MTKPLDQMTPLEAFQATQDLWRGEEEWAQELFMEPLQDKGRWISWIFPLGGLITIPIYRPRPESTSPRWRFGW